MVCRGDRMSAEKIKNTNVLKFKEYIPQEFIKGIMSRELNAIAGFFNDEYVGALVYEESGALVVIRSIYVDPAFRLLEVGTDLFELLPKKEISVTYEAEEDRVTLEPFFEAMDVALDRYDAPFANFTLGDAKKALKRIDASRCGDYGVFQDELDVKQEDIVMSWFKNEFGEVGLDGEVYSPCSIFYIENDQVKGAVFIRRDEANDFDIILNGPDSPPDDLLVVDYIFCDSSNKKVLPGMMYKLVSRLAEEYRDTTVIQGLIMSEKGMELYKSMFGEPEMYIPVFST